MQVVACAKCGRVDDDFLYYGSECCGESRFTIFYTEESYRARMKYSQSPKGAVKDTPFNHAIFVKRPL